MRLDFAAISLALLCIALPTATATAQTGYPSKPIRLVIPLQPGGLVDGFARVMGQHLTERMGQPVVVENRPGGSQIIAADVTAKAAPDGHTLMIGSQAGLVLSTLAQTSFRGSACWVRPGSPGPSSSGSIARGRACCARLQRARNMRPSASR